MKTGLALSGGGVRASVFHLGVLARLAETEIWETLNHISTVSGGSLGIALVFEKSGKKWPSKNAYLSECLPAAFEVLTTCNLQAHYLADTVLKPWRLLQGRAHIIGKLIEMHWGISSCISDIPEHPRWTINATCYETGKNWRFHKKRMGDYIANYVVNPEFPLSDAVAASAAVPGLIGPLRIRTGKYLWKKYEGWDKRADPEIDAKPITKSLTIWDGGVYDNLGAEAIYKTNEGLRHDLDFALISDASQSLGVIDRKWLKNIALPCQPTRLINIPTDQVRSLRARELFGFFEKKNNGGYLRMGESVEKICRNLNVPIPEKTFMPTSEVKLAAEFPTTLKSLTHEEFQILFRHGFEVCSAVLYGIKKTHFQEYDHSKFDWMK